MEFPQGVIIWGCHKLVANNVDKRTREIRDGVEQAGFPRDSSCAQSSRTSSPASEFGGRMVEEACLLRRSTQTKRRQCADSPSSFRFQML
jgi:hypothetical protein